jgi:phosphoserine phosphatase RsbU/P
MAELIEIKRTLSRIEKLEREINLKQLQINSLLAITQAINDNVASDGLFSMYNNFLKWEIGIKKMALLFKEDNKWVCKTSIDISEELFDHEIARELAQYKSTSGLESATHPFVKEFDLVVPVIHKTSPIAYAFIGGFDDQDDVYNKVQFVTTITNVIAVAIENKRFFKKQLRQEVLNREVELAAEIQRTLVPNKLPSGKNYELSSIYKPHSVVGGDYYDVVEFADGKILFCIADITGKGVAAALLMANFQANLHSLVHRCETLEEIVHEMNTAVYKVTQGDRFITFFIARYDSNTRTLHYINAGHTPPILMMMNGEFTTLRNGTTVLGFLPELPFLEIGGVCLTAESLLFTYTDGLTDIRNRNSEDFDENRLADFLKKNLTFDAKTINSKLLEHVEVFRERVPLPDDVTVLTCKLF